MSKHSKKVHVKDHVQRESFFLSVCVCNVGFSETNMVLFVAANQGATNSDTRQSTSSPDED